MSGADWLSNAIASATPSECVEWPFARQASGYGAVRIAGRTVGAHRLACTLAHGPAPFDRAEAAHVCGNAPCVNPHHIRWATSAENQRDRVGHGTSNRGERYGLAKLRTVDVIAIRWLADIGARQADIARLFDVKQPTVSGIVSRKSWGWL